MFSGTRLLLQVTFVLEYPHLAALNREPYTDLQTQAARAVWGRVFLLHRPQHKKHLATDTTNMLSAFAGKQRPHELQGARLSFEAQEKKVHKSLYRILHKMPEPYGRVPPAARNRSMVFFLFAGRISVLSNWTCKTTDGQAMTQDVEHGAFNKKPLTRIQKALECSHMCHCQSEGVVKG